ncbi:craniofacial development protein 2-like [Palaemon carinicauda]|uniref:craniofacial development protein 2-like n=1 Tax=Palaemon carinicauda TaxID=392227 RepID=UPI0035B64D83
MTGHGKEVADMIERREIQILCVQETRWKRNKAKEIGGGYKLFYGGCSERGRSGAGIILTGNLMSCVFEVERINDRMMRMKLEWDGEILNVISVYAPQTGSTEEEKDDFWRQLNQEIINIPNEELLMVGGDLNGHVGRYRQGLEGIYRGWGLGDRNQYVERVMDFVVAVNMAVINTFFENEPKYLTTHKSGVQESQIDFVLGRRVHLKEISNCKIFSE